MKNHIILPLIITAILIVMAPIHVQAQTISKNLSLADMIRYEELYQFQAVDTTTYVTLTDVASWKNASNGKEYALVGLLAGNVSSNGVAMVDVTDPGNADHYKTIRISEEDDDNRAHDVKVHNNIAYVAQDGNDEFPVYWVDLEVAADIINKNNAQAGTDTTGFGIPQLKDTKIHNVFVNEEHDLLFMSDFRSNQPILVFDISDVPNSEPKFVGEIPQVASYGLSHDLFAMEVNGTAGRVYDASILAVTMSDYTWDKGGSGFQVGTQLTHEFNPRRGVHPGTFSPAAEFRQIHSTWIGQNTNYLFTTVEGRGGWNEFDDTWVPEDSVD